MEIEAAIKNHLKNHAALKKIHKGNVTGGIAPEDWKAPYQSYFFISDPPESRRLGVPVPRIQINNFAPTYDQARLMAKLTREALDGFFGTMGGAGGVKVITGLYQDVTDLYEADTKLYNCPVDVKIQYRN
jgi:hypothetical protein